jgi:hypothetical protein
MHIEKVDEDLNIHYSTLEEIEKLVELNHIIRSKCNLNIIYFLIESNLSDELSLKEKGIIFSLNNLI